MENKLIVLPKEVAQIAENVSAEKKIEVQKVLNNVFDGVSKMREQLDNVKISDENDKVGMKLANTIRLSVRQVRLEAEKIFDAKRAEVQAQMLGFKTEDQLWLKAKQTMQILTKEIEENARWKEETKERFEAEQKEIKVQQRVLLISEFVPDMPRNEFENMSDEVFESFYSGIKKTYNDRIEEEKRIEEERVAKEKAEAEERERIVKENERLRIEAEEKEKQLTEERVKAEEERRTIEEKARKEREEAEKERLRLEAEIKARKDEEERIKKEEQDRIALAEKEKADAEEKARNAPDKEKLLELASQVDNILFPMLNGEEFIQILSVVKSRLSDISSFIREKVK